MALIKCPECNKEISDRAKVCIHCGCATILQANNIKRKPKVWMIIAGAFLAALIVLVALFGNVGVADKVERVLSNDLGEEVIITELYYNKKQNACLVEFETYTTMDVAGVYLDSEKVLYDSDFDYYQRKFKSATSSSERGKWSSKVLEYADLAEWQFAVAMATSENDYGWKKIR